MFEVLSSAELKAAIESHKIIENGVVENCEEIKYDFRLGEKILKAEFKKPIVYSELSAVEKARCEIAPGEVVFVMTEEKLSLPDNVFCQLSNKRKIGHGGIVVLGGLMIDPQYKGRLIFGLYNVSSVPYPLKPGKKLVAGIFYKTDGIGTGSTFIPEEMDDFPDDLVDSMSKYQPFSASNATIQLELLQKRLILLEDKLSSDSEWKDTFKKGLSDVSTKLEDIANQLSTEINNRQSGQSQLEKKMATLKGIGLVLSGLLGGGLVSLLVMWIAGILQIG